MPTPFVSPLATEMRWLFPRLPLRTQRALVDLARHVLEIPVNDRAPADDRAGDRLTIDRAEQLLILMDAAEQLADRLLDTCDQELLC